MVAQRRPTRTPPRRRRPAPAARRRRRALLAAVGVLLLVAVGVVVGLALRSREPGPVGTLYPRTGAPSLAHDDPFAYRPGHDGDLEQRAADGFAHVLYARSPDGIVPSAARVARWRPLIDRATDGTGVDPDLLEALVLVESAGREDAIAGGTDPTAASGLTQIVAETGRNLLAMPIDLAASKDLTTRLAAARGRGDAAAVTRLEAERRAADPRFDPEKALAGAVRYLRYARGLLGRDDLAFVSYHMGIGNLSDVIRAYAGAPAGTSPKGLVDDGDLSYARLYFDSSPVRHAAAWNRLASLGDDSANYYWKLLAARDVMRLYRHDRDALERLAAAHAQKASGEEVLRPPDSTETFADARALAGAWLDGRIQRVPSQPARLGFRLDPTTGQLAQELGQRRALYRGLRPESLALLVYLARSVRDQTGGTGALTVTSTVRDVRYQERLRLINEEAAKGYSVHTTGYAFDVLRSYTAKGQATAFQFMLDRLQALNVIAWIREPKAIHVAVGPLAEPLVPAELQHLPARG